MARGSKGARAAAKQAAEDRKSNLTEECFLTHFNAYATLRRELDEKSSELRLALKRAKAEGVNRRMLVKCYADRRQDSDKIEADERDLARYRRWLRMPIGAQANMFEEDEEGDGPPVGDDKAYDDGFFAGSEAKNFDTNPHAADTPEHQRWSEGWYAAQNKRAMAMGEKEAA